MDEKRLIVEYLGKVDYHEAWNIQKDRVRQIDQGEADRLLLLEHPPTFTMGKTAHEENLLIDEHNRQEKNIELVYIDRGGDVTYHGPGQCVGYPIFHLGRKSSPRTYIHQLEETLIQVLAGFGIEGSRKEQYPGVWVGDEKICAVGVKFNLAKERKGHITSHGFAFNVNTDLSYFDLIVPCGIKEFGVTSLKKLLGKEIPMREFQETVARQIARTFGFASEPVQV